MMVRSTKLACPELPIIAGTLGKSIDQHYPQTDSRTFELEIITPIFNGGVDVGQINPISVIRSSAIRGHLRFWWRATRGINCRSVIELKQKEAIIWGSVDNPSPVTITTDVPQWKNTRKANNAYGFAKNGPESYVLFPAKEEQYDIVKEGLKFELNLCWFNQDKIQRQQHLANTQRKKLNKTVIPVIDDITLDIEVAVWAWVNFGGIGARTRRGCGAIYCKELSPLSFEVFPDWLGKAHQKYQFSKPNSHVDWPAIDLPLLVNKKPQEALTAWNAVIDIYKAFRQGVNVGRNQFANRNIPGRSRWPEADSIRKITGKGEANHMESITLPAEDDSSAFPRAEFGLPIQFKFVEKSLDNKNNCELYPQDKSRMASPIIIKPIALQGKSQALAMVLPLKTPLLDKLELKNLDVDKPPSLTLANIRRSALSQYTNSPMGPPNPNDPPLSANGSAIEAFLAYVKTKGFAEIKQ